MNSSNYEQTTFMSHREGDDNTEHDNTIDPEANNEDLVQENRLEEETVSEER